MRDIRHGERVSIRRAEQHMSPVYKAGQRTMEIHREATDVRWSGYYRDLYREGAIEVVPDAEKKAADEELLEQLAGAGDDKGFSQLCDDVKAAAESTAVLLEQHGSQLAAATCRAAALSKIGKMREVWLQLQQADAEAQE